jgi:glycosyltransferase involved in cell wall biosynthesis
VFESLQNQTFRDFEWLIVDDGSEDNTAAVVAEFKAKATFPLRYFLQENQGKHIAFNRGVQLAEGHLFLTIDSDDGLLSEALAIFNRHWLAIPDGQKADFCGVTGRCQTQNGDLVGKRDVPNDLLDTFSLDWVYRYKMTHEMSGFVTIAILKAFPFPEHIKKAYVTEAIVWSKIGKRYKTRYVNDVVRIYYVNEDHESISKSIRPNSRCNYDGLILYYQQVMEEHLNYFFHAPVLILKAAIQYSRYGFKMAYSIVQQWSKLQNSGAKGLFLAVLPIAIAFHIFDKLKG